MKKITLTYATIALLLLALPASLASAAACPAMHTPETQQLCNQTLTTVQQMHQTFYAGHTMTAPTVPPDATASSYPIQTPAPNTTPSEAQSEPAPTTEDPTQQDDTPTPSQQKPRVRFF